MDVTSLLNTASAGRGQVAVEPENTQILESALTRPSNETHTSPSTTRTPFPDRTPSRRTSESKLPSRNRTPWDANGYALPLTLDTKLPSTMTRPLLYSESPVDSVSPKSPRHKFSDSHSSMSSYASSSTSFSHSRLSSMSTVGGLQTLDTIPDVSTLEINGCQSATESRQGGRSDGSISPQVALEGHPILGSGRPGSPSDAMLMSKGMQALDRMSPPETIVTTIHSTNPSPNSFLLPPDLPKAHKRAVSAPHITSVHISDRTPPPLPQLTFQPTPPSQPGDRQPTFTMSNISPTGEELDQSTVCMYVEDCDTGSQLRKVVSHVFGRNKLCTRAIPSYVWVSYCRKHYQRGRYRNQQDWAMIQCKLVVEQIRRIQTWSNVNEMHHQYPIVRDWALSMRKREQNRVEKQGTRKRYHGVDEEEDALPDDAHLHGTAVPEWLRERCGDGYSTDQITDIARQIRDHVEEYKMTQFPDIEILPNMVMDDTAAVKSKAPARRTATAHKRSQSVGMAVHSQSSPMARRISQPGTNGSHYGLSSSPESSEKRQRMELQANQQPAITPRLARAPHSFTTPQFPATSLSATSPYSVITSPPHFTAGPRPIHNLAHRPAYRSESYSDGTVGRTTATPQTYGAGPLPAPMPQRLGGAPVAAQLENGSMNSSYLSAPRPSHKRSQSEFVTSQYSNGPPSYYDDAMPDPVTATLYNDRSNGGHGYRSYSGHTASYAGEAFAFRSSYGGHGHGHVSRASYGGSGHVPRASYAAPSGFPPAPLHNYQPYPSSSTHLPYGDSGHASHVFREHR